MRRKTNLSKYNENIFSIISNVEGILAVYEAENNISNSKKWKLLKKKDYSKSLKVNNEKDLIQITLNLRLKNHFDIFLIKNMLKHQFESFFKNILKKDNQIEIKLNIFSIE